MTMRVFGFGLLLHALCLSEASLSNFDRNFSLVSAVRGNILPIRRDSSPCSNGQILSDIMYAQLLYVCNSPYITVRQYSGCLLSCPFCICVDCMLCQDSPQGAFYDSGSDSASCIDCLVGSFLGRNTPPIGCIC
jgi:hypothetical protein